MWDLSSPTRGWTHIPCIWRWILNHWTTREVPRYSVLQTVEKSFPTTVSNYSYFPGIWYCLHFLTLHLWYFPFQTFSMYRCFYLINPCQLFLLSLFPRRQRWERSLVHSLQGGALRQEEVRLAVWAVDGRLVTTARFSWLWPLTKDWITTPSPDVLPCPWRLIWKTGRFQGFWWGEFIHLGKWF